MTTLQSGDTAELRRLEPAGRSQTTAAPAIVEQYEYDGTNRRIQIFSNFSGSDARHGRRTTITPASRSSRAI